MYGFKAFVFDGKRTAGKALDTLEDYAPAYTWIDDVATVSKSKHGHMRVHSTWAQDDSNVGVGTGLGAMTGAMVGLFSDRREPSQARSSARRRSGRKSKPNTR